MTKSWNWTFWERVLQPLVAELASTAVGPALVAPPRTRPSRRRPPTFELATRQTVDFLYVIAVRRGGTTSRLTFSGLPRRRDGRPIGGGQALLEYVQIPPTPPIGAGRQTFRNVKVAGGSFGD